MRFGGLAAFTSGSALAFGLLFACGARTELEGGVADLVDSGVRDASRDVSLDGPPDAAPDVSLDAPVDAPPDVSLDAPPDVSPDAPDSDIPEGCDAGDTSIVLLSGNGDLTRFDPVTFATSYIGTLNCGEYLNSMTRSRSGTLYLNSQNGELYTAELADPLNCVSTPFDGSQVDYYAYGMGFTADDVPSGETLFIAPRNTEGGVDLLSKIDLSTYQRQDVGYLTESTPAAEVKGTGDGRLYLVHMASETQSARLIQIDKQTGAFGKQVELPVGWPYQAFDFAFWGGVFYVFVSLQGESSANVIRYDPALDVLEELGTIPVVAVGAAVSTCAPL